MLKKHSSYGSNPSNLHSPQAKDEGEEHTKKQKITWDEVTIAEHDKERGTRQKVDEAPTPYRYLSESDQSEAESGSDGEHLFRCRRGSGSLFHDRDQLVPGGNLLNSSNDNIVFQPPAQLMNNNTNGKPPFTNNLMNSLDALHAKLEYEKHLQDLQHQFEDSTCSDTPTAQSVATNNNINSKTNNNSNSSNNKSSNIASNGNEASTGAGRREGRMSIDVPTSSSSTTVPPSLRLITTENTEQHPVRSAIKKQHSSSNMNVLASSPTKQVHKRSNNNNPDKPHKTVFIKPTHHEIFYTTPSSAQTSPVPTSSNNNNNNSNNSFNKPAVILPLSTNTNTTATTSNSNPNPNNSISIPISIPTNPNPNSNNSNNNDSLFAGIHNTTNLREDGSGSSYTYGLQSPGPSSTGPSGNNNNINNTPSTPSLAAEPVGEVTQAQFRNKRAGHYNEYKVLLAMRAKKLAANEEEEEEDSSSDEDDARTETSTTSSVGAGSISSGGSKKHTRFGESPQYQSHQIIEETVPEEETDEPESEAR